MVFNKLVSFQLDYAPQYQITKYISERTKLQLVHVNHKSSPLVQGYFAVATECPTDSGTPHTLEHLIFMGSQKHHYKGLLDTAGNLCMSSTNAWTATDQTVYTLTTAGWKGFQKLLPAYLDHILNPTLTDAACMTEVYHIDPEDLTDKGVVYSEMEAIESQSWFVTMLEKQRLLFPQGSGYRSETGGLTNNLRKLTNEEIKSFHKSQYSSHNLCIIVCGNVPEDELLATVQEFDDSIKEMKTTRQRPFVDTKESQIPKSRNEIVESTVEFPELDESQGEILFSWIGESYMDHKNDLAVSMLLDYFTETALAPFVKQLVEIDDPMANSVDYWTDDFMRTIVNLGIHGVPTEKLDQTKAKALEILKTHRMDLTRMKQVIDNSKWEYVLRCEKNGDSTLSQAAITDFIYGKEDGSSLVSSIKTLNDFDDIMAWNIEQWNELLSKILIENKPVIVLGKPSSSLYENLDEEKAKLIKKRKEEFTADTKAELLEALSKAKIHNDKPIPTELLAKFEIEDPSKSVEFIKTENVCLTSLVENTSISALNKKLIEAKPTNFPFSLHLEHFPSQFIELHCLLNSTQIKDTTLLPYYHILDELFSMPMKDENTGEVISYEDVVSQLKSETVDSQISLGLQGQAPDLIDIRIRCKSDNYSQAVKWIEHCLFDMIFDEKRVSVLLENYLNSIVELKREGDIMLESITSRNLYTERSVKKSVDPLFVEKLCEDILDDIEDGKFKSKILPRLETMRDQLKESFTRLQFLVLGDIHKISSNFYKPWEGFITRYANVIPAGYQVKAVPPIPRPLLAVSNLCKSPASKAFIITTPASESSYMNVLTPVKFDLNYDHPDYAAVSLASEYLQCVEGPFWKGIRGQGFAYGANMRRLTEINSWGFNIYRGADIIKCYQTAREIVKSYSDGTVKFDQQLIAGAVSSIINRIATIENGYFASGISNFVDDILLQRGRNFNEKFLKSLDEVTADDLRNAIQKYLVNLFVPERSVVFISCHPSRLESTKEFLESEDFEVEVEELEDDEEDQSDNESENQSS
ncbi:hypothetical protein KAFR_0C01430 [Kazachstania africana CBS 2517]|uniref:Mitochondrial presequence protease n=1 Tax=Kazachstania africana (strain ATCC 22294 / BCRC 22015 / CBS 2517 / CECT 1963 / NBRC 1671 / NRRL Y-8276) TaxID=1071382 RepID=H2ARY6_KAZAF|nr:hypothetical protein KAFR_0C01430 [Kazachstania africana CBS 2517]CCF57136.1 hypothetical protein KAFR_0C01430 [Kazachstania africana CBS 2517]